MTNNRQHFRKWLKQLPSEKREISLPDLVQRYGRKISVSSAYRVAMKIGVRGNRRNRTRFAEFWGTINWRLPDSVLSNVWACTRGNIRQRRVRLGVGSPAYVITKHRTTPQFREELEAEYRRARQFSGPRPC